MIFLIDYDRRAGRLVSLRSFDPSERQSAQEARLNLELSLQDPSNQREIVLLDAASLDALRLTHRRYFVQSVQELMTTQTQSSEPKP
jgi:hypothetical protein